MSTTSQASVSKPQRHRSRYFLVALALLVAGGSPQVLRAQARDRGAAAAVAVDERPRPQRQRQRVRRAPSARQSDVIATSETRNLIRGIDRTLQFLNQTVQRLPRGSEQRLQMLARILNLNLEQAAYLAGSEQEFYDRAWSRWQEGGRRGPEPKLDTSRSRTQWQKVSDLADSILGEYPKAPAGDAVAFNGALALQFLNRESEAARRYQRIIESYPQSPFSGDAHYSLGDYYFDQGRFAQAAPYYQSATEYRSSRRYGWALYKLGWCFYNLGNFERSLDYWKQTVKYAQSAGNDYDRLQEQALQDMIFSFSEQGDVDSAIRYYQANRGNKYVPQLLKLLAQTLTEKGDFREAIEAWQRLLRLHPYSEEAFAAQVEIIALAFDDGNYRILWRELERLESLFGPRSRWAGRNSQEVVRAAQEQTKDLLLYYPKVIHKAAQKAKSRPGFAAARQGYLLFLKRYPRAREVYEIREYLGDIEYFAGNFRQAGDLYFAIARAGKDKALTYDGDKPKANIHQRSSKNMLDSYNRDLGPELARLLKVKPDFTDTPRTLSPAARNFIRGCNFYMKWYPRDKATMRNCETFTGELFYRTQNRRMAEKYLWTIVRKYPDSKEGQTAADHLIVMNRRTPPRLKATALALLKIPVFQRGPMASKLREVVREVELTQIAGEQSEGKRAELFEQQAKRSPQDRDADKFWNNAAADYLAAGEFDRAMAAYQSLIRGYPKSRLYFPALLQLGKLYDDLLNFEQAAQLFALYAQKQPKAEQAPAALQRACELRIALGQGKAIPTCTSFAQRYPEGGVLAIEKLIDALWRERQYGPMRGLIYSQYFGKFRLSPNQQVLAHYKVFKAFGPKNAAGRRALRGIRNAGRRQGALSGEALRYLGEVTFLETQGLDRRFRRLQLAGGSPERLQASIERISGELAKLEQAYSRVLKTQDAYWGVAAFYQLGAAYEYFAGLLAAPPTIPGVPREDLVAQLAASVEQVRTQSKEYYSSGLQTSRRFTIYNDWAVKIFNGLNRVFQRQVSFDEFIVAPDFVGSELPEQVKVALQ